jgi:hypothetical protein
MANTPNPADIVAAIRSMADGDGTHALNILEGLTPRSSTIVSTRVSIGTARALRSHARALRTTPGAVLRAMVERAANPKDRKRLTDLLGLDPDALDSEIAAAVEALLAATSDTAAAPPAGAGATGGNADPPPAPTPFKRALTKAERSYCAKHKITAEQFQARTRAAVRTQPKKGK